MIEELEDNMIEELEDNIPTSHDLELQLLCQFSGSDAKDDEVVICRQENIGRVCASSSGGSNNLGLVCVSFSHIDWAWVRRLGRLRALESVCQYQLACLSTLGGGYFLCNKHEIAFNISRQLYILGEYMNNNSIRVKSLIYLGMNLWMMGGGRRRAARRAFRRARGMASASGCAALLQLVEAAELWCDAQMLMDASCGDSSSGGALVVT
jgi:hypothetical protein